MPELPEVETIKRFLASRLTSRQILSSDLLWSRSLVTPTAVDFGPRLQGQTVQGFGRRGKYLLMQCSLDWLIFHLRMSGDLVIRQSPCQLEKHDRLVLYLSGGDCLVFNDTRKFGRFWLTDDLQQVLGKLGPEPLEAAFTPALLFAMLTARHRQLKPLLLDQGFLAGLGNIYTDEILHKARQHPLSLSDRLSLDDSEHLWQAIREVLQQGILSNGTSIDWVYRGGDFQNHLQVYGREGQACQICGTIIVKIRVGQRGTHFCPLCQIEKDG